MALSDDVIALVHDLSGAGLAVTLIGTPQSDPEGPASPDPASSAQNNNPETKQQNTRANMTKDDEGRQKYSSMAAEVCPTRDSAALQKKLAKKIDVRYLNEIRSFKDKIKSSYLLQSCNQQQCPRIQERLNHHQHKYHSHFREPEQASCSTGMKRRDQAINVSPTLSRMRLPKFTLPTTEEGRIVQTDITMRDFCPNTSRNMSKMTSDMIDKDIPLRRSQTRDVLPKRNYYKEHLQNEILNWLQNVPMFYSLNFTTKDIKENIVDNLAEKINSLVNEVCVANYEEKTKIEIENCLCRLPMWLPNSKQDQALFKDGLKEKLWIKIKALNENFYGIKYAKSVGSEKEQNIDVENKCYEKEITDWSQKLQLKDLNSAIKCKLVDLLMKRLTPLLKIPLHTTSYKLILKGEIIDILDDLPLTLTSPRFKTVQLNRFAEDLANRLLTIQIKQEAGSSKVERKDNAVSHQCASQVMGVPLPSKRCSYKTVIHEKVSECLGRIQVSHRNDLVDEICYTFLDSKDHLRTGDESSIKNEIRQFLRDTGKLSEEKSLCVAIMIIQEVKEAINGINSTSTSFDSVIPELSGTISVYMWGKKDTPVTSTPKKQSKKDIPKLNPEERSYMVRVADLIRKWMDTLPKQYDEDQKFKETIINDLAGDIMDELKVEQLAPETSKDKQKYLNYLMYRWLYRFEFFSDDAIRNDAKPFIEQFLQKLKTLQVPELTAPQHGTRQAMGAIKHMEGEHGWEEDYLAKGIDVLEDQISVWMNEQPTEIYANKDKFKRNKQAHDLALTLQDRLRNNSPENEIEEDINNWLTKVVKPKEKEHIGLLTHDLKEKVMKTPQDETLEGNFEDRKRYIADRIEAKRKEATQPTKSKGPSQVSNYGNVEGDTDKTIREFIGRFIKENYDIQDPMAIDAFCQLLKTTLRKLSPQGRQEVYENFGKPTSIHDFAPEKLKNELEYINVISEWLKNIPIDPSYNKPGNNQRIEFVNDLATNIIEIEEDRLKSPNEMNYNYLIASLILNSMHMYGLPILPEHKNNTPLMVDQLLQKLVALRLPHNSNVNVSQPSASGSQSLDASDIKEQNLSEFIADYIRVNGREIADDEAKLEAWTARLLKEVKDMLREGADPSTLCKAQVYTRFAEVPIPRDESLKRYSLEIDLVKEISDWMKNLPLLEIAHRPEAQEGRILMISELAERMTENDTLNNFNANDKVANKAISDYITDWISRLPLDTSKELIIPIVVQQLLNRMERVSKRHQPATEPINEVPQVSSESPNTESIDNKKKSKDKQTSKDKSTGSPRSSKVSNVNPATIIVEAIENWSNKLPIKGDNKDAIKLMKEGIARKLYQKIGELNVDPKIFNDDLLYKDMLGDEIDTQLENIPQSPELQKNREKLKDVLLNTILDTKKIIKEKSAGDNYKHKLETTIDVSIPNPIQNTQSYDPGFEIYKNHLANMFILENFDHANDDVKAKYEKRIRYEIDKYFESAQNRNALPLTKDQIYNELYSALFKVPMPNENSVIDEVEQVKTRCEVDTWFEDLPLKKPDGVGELLEWDKILSTLTKRIHEIEKRDPKSDKKIHKEIVKWLEKLPLLPGNEDVNSYANKLQKILKATAQSRKYVSSEPKVKGKNKKLKEEIKNKKDSPNKSQVPGPSSAGQKWESPLTQPNSKATIAKPCIAISPMTYKKPGDIIAEVVEDWCNQLPLISSEENNKAIKDNLSTRIIVQISELNMDPEIFNDDILYDELLDQELDNVLSNLPVCCDFDKSKAARKHQLKEIIKSIKPLIKDEIARHDYKEELNNTVASILKIPSDTTEDKIKMFIKLKDEIVDNFVQYNYNKNDDEGKQIYKRNVHDAVVKYFMDIKDNVTDEHVDPLVRRNQLLSELGRIPIPNEALKEEVEEIKMRKEVEQFFRDQSIPEGEMENKMIKNISKRLHRLEKSGHNSTNDKKMRSDILRGLKKLNYEVSPTAVDDFVERLKQNEKQRKMPPLTDSQASDLNKSPVNGRYADPAVTYPQQSAVQFTIGPQSPQHKNTYSEPNQVPGEQWISMQSATPPPALLDSGYQNPFAKESIPEEQVWFPHVCDAGDQSYYDTVNYADFEGGQPIIGSLATQGYAQPAHDLGHSDMDYQDFARGPFLNSSMAPGSGAPEQPPVICQKSCKSQTECAPVQRQPSYGQVATPRQVAQSPNQAPQPPAPNDPTPGDVTPESLFQAPIYKPVPVHRPFTVPVIEPTPMPGSKGSMRPQRPITAPGNALPTAPPESPMGPPTIGDGRRPKGFQSSDDDELVCKCESIRIRGRGMPFCMIAMEEFYDDCISPMWCGMPYPECFYY